MKHRFFYAFMALMACMAILVSCAPTQVLPPMTPTPPLTPFRPAKIALVLGAGAAKGFAHIGVLKILEANKVPVHMIVGTSVGSFVGSLYAYGFDAFQMQAIAHSLEREDLIDVTLPDNGFVRGERLENYVNKTLRNTPIEKLRIPFYAIATNIQTGEEMIFGTGNTGMAVRASCSIPGVFMPQNISGSTYVDGGVVSPMGIDAARKFGADIVIAVDISSSIDSSLPQSTLDTMLQSINIMYTKIALAQLHKADVVIRPNVGFIGSADFAMRHEAIVEGEKAATSALPKIMAIISKLKTEGRLP